MAGMILGGCRLPPSPPPHLFCPLLRKTPSNSAWSWPQEIETENVLVGRSSGALASGRAHPTLPSCRGFGKTHSFFPSALRGAGGPGTDRQRLLELDRPNAPFSLRRGKGRLKRPSIAIAHPTQGPAKNSVLPARREEQQPGQEEAQAAWKATRRHSGTGTTCTPLASATPPVYAEQEVLGILSLFLK